MTPEFRRGVVTAADVADAYNAESTHPHRLGDCILAKLNVGRRKPRRNRQVQRREQDAWMIGFATALAEMHRRLLSGNDGSGVQAVARAAGLTIEAAHAAGVSAFDVRELRKAGIRTAPWQPATGYRIPGIKHAFKTPPGSLVFADCCRKRRRAGNVELQVFYDLTRARCIAGKVCRS